MDDLDAYLSKLEDNERRYLDALTHIQHVLAPANSPHTRESIQCQGCLYDYEEAIDTVNRVLEGGEA